MSVVRAPRWSSLILPALAACAVSCDHNTAGLAPTGNIAGSVTSSIGALGGVSLVATPHGGKAMPAVTSNSTGAFLVVAVPAVTGSGSIAVSGVPVNCTTPSPVDYTGLAADDSLIVPINVECVPPTGTISGTITSSLGGGISGASVTLTPTGGAALAAASSSSSGAYAVSGVSVGDGTGAVAVSSLPSNCTTPSPLAYSGLTFKGSVTVNVTVTCTPLIGTINGTITSSLGGGIASASITVTPTGGTAIPVVTSSSTGSYAVTGVPVGAGTGTVGVSSLPTNCTAPSPKAYSGLTSSTALTVDITVTCTVITGTVSGTVTSTLGGGIANASVTVTPSGGSAAPAVSTSGTGAYAATVPVGTGSGAVSVSSLPGNCTAPSPVAYSGLAAGRTVTANVTVTCVPLTGNLTITVNAPNNVTNPSISVTGPNGYSQSLSATQTLTGLTPGAYTVTGATYMGGVCLAMFRDTALVTGSPATITGNATVSVTVTYVPEPTGMWVADATGTDEYAHFTQTQLVQSGAQTPADVITGATPDSPIDIAFDRQGNLWSVDATTNTLQEYAPASFGTPGATPTGSVNFPGLDRVTGLAFDVAGNMWLADYHTCQIDEFSANELSGLSGPTTLAPIVQLNNCGFDRSLSGPSALAFDFNGNLWVVDIDNHDVYMYAAASLGVSGNVEPVVRLTTPDNMTGQYLAFDASGNLWVTGEGGRVIEFSSSQLGTSATVTPAVSITVSGAQLEGLGFDTNGNLWVVDAAGRSVDELTTSQLSTGGTLTPAIIVGTANGGAADQPWTLAFFPHAYSLPLYNRVPQRVRAVRR